MKSVTDVLHRTPWWALILGALAIFVALGVFVTPYHILQYRGDEAKSSEETRAIQREIDNTFVENAINVGRGVVKGMLARTTDPDRRAELEEALAGLEEAREEIRTAGTEALRARKDAIRAAVEAQRATLEAVRNARRETEEALKEVDPKDQAMRKQLEETLAAAAKAEQEAEKALRDSKAKRITIGPNKGGKPMIDIQIEGMPKPPEPPAVPGAAVPGASLDVPSPPLPPEVATKIRRDVTGDMYRIGIGAGLILILLPLFILAVVTKFFADRSRASLKVAEAKRKEADYARMTQQVTEAKLSALQAQVEPHFLYNTLASVQALTEVDPAKANEMTGHLIQYLRNALPKMRESVSTVGQEVELVRAYLSILQMRMGTRLAFEIDVPEALGVLPFPPLMLPSLVENAIKHGLEPQREGGVIRVSASLDDGRLKLKVADTGRGFGETVGAGVGLANIRERLAALYGDNAKLTLEGNEPQGVVATIEVPAEGARQAAASAPPAAPAPVPKPVVETPATVRVERSGFWAETWDVCVVVERLWRKALYYIYIGLLACTALLAVGLIVGIGVGAFPVVMGDDVVTGPLGFLIGLAGAIIGFFAVGAALAMVMVIVYALGFLLVAILLFTVCAVLIGLSPVLAPIALLVLLIWWMARKRGTKPERVEPVMQTPAPEPVTPPPTPSAEPGR